MTAYSEATKGRRHTTESAFLLFSKRSVSLCVLFGVVCHKQYIVMASGQFKRCVHPCPRFLTGGDTHQLCVHCLGVQHARAALEGAACADCEALPIRVLRSRLAVFNEAGQVRAPRGLGPASAEAARRLKSWGSQMDLSGGLETAAAHSQSSSGSSDVLTPRVEARIAASSAREEDPMFELSDSEELDVLSFEAGEIAGSSPPHSPTFEELVDVLSRAVAKLNINWPQEKQEVQVKSKLDERFLQHRSQPQRRGLPFFPDLHNELCKSWNKPYSARLSNPPVLDYSNILGACEYGYGTMPRVEEALASYLSPDVASSLKAPVLPTKPCRVTSSLVGRAYMAAGRAGACLHTMALMQAYQADFLKDLDEGEGPTPGDLAELRRAADLCHRPLHGGYGCNGETFVAKLIGDKGKGQGLSPRCPDIAFWPVWRHSQYGRRQVSGGEEAVCGI